MLWKNNGYRLTQPASFWQHIFDALAREGYSGVALRKRLALCGLLFILDVTFACYIMGLETGLLFVGAQVIITVCLFIIGLLL